MVEIMRPLGFKLVKINSSKGSIPFTGIPDPGFYHANTDKCKTSLLDEIYVRLIASPQMTIFAFQLLF